MNSMLITLIVISAILYLVFALYYENKIYKFIWKPGTMILIIILAITESGLSTTFSYWVLSALVFSLIGDIFLMLREKWFIHGLVSFLIAHILYIVGFIVSFSFTFSFNIFLLVVALILLAVILYFYLFPNVRKEGGKKLLFAVAFYIIIITTMVSLAIMTGTKILIAAAFLFFVSDAILAVNKFKVRFRLADYFVMSTYFTAQLLFAISIGGQ
ncbi:lysoplasmalogenase [Sutcliffiella sp. NC1]|uniref:lysoplasmalogenase n=1 Tax=Sutcliffiella sp. NC1 TaxID=3004096 RepID=UPI0022DCEC7E|nr:lysoplasmalogenase [Sutcliffiella sp. NC1]WBL15751.1 lysoplasmalogenase [Sutcliffiella sp. NC1]